MRFTISAAALAFASTAFAQTAGFDALTTPTKNEQIPAGQTYTVNWQASTYINTTDTVTLSLLGGATPETLQVLGSLASGVQNSAATYTWTVDSSLGDLATYGIKISLDKDTSIFQYSFPFSITGSSSESSSVTAAGYPTAGTTSASSSSSAVETYSASATVTASASSYAATTVSSSSFPSLTPSGTAGVSGVATGTGVSTVSTSTVKSSATSSSSSTATPVATNGAPRAAAGVTAVLLAALAAVFAF